MTTTRTIAAKLARDFITDKIDYKEFCLNYPDNVDDDMIVELLELIEHKPKKGGLFGISQSQHDFYFHKINNLIEKLENEK